MNKLSIVGYSKMRPVRILIKLREYAGWSESSLGGGGRRGGVGVEEHMSEDTFSDVVALL